MSEEDLASIQQYLNYAWDEQLFLLIGVAAFLGLGKGGVPGLSAIATAATVATSPQHIPGGLGLAVALQVPILTLMDIAAACLHAKNVDVQVVLVLLPLSFVGMCIGQWLTGHLNEPNSRLLIGVLLLTILCVQLGNDTIVRRLAKRTSTAGDHVERQTDKDAQIHDMEAGPAYPGHIPRATILTQRKVSHNRSASQETAEASSSILSSSSTMKRRRLRRSWIRQTNWTWACVVGLIGGAATMLTNAMGPILNIYLLNVVQLSPSAYVATRALFFCVINAGKIPIGFMAGTLALPMMPLVSLLGAISVCGVMGAKPILLRIDADKFVKLELAVVAFSGLQLCWMGLFGG
jgi:uncharacterized membrane protein YfcA